MGVISSLYFCNNIVIIPVHKRGGSVNWKIYKIYIFKECGGGRRIYKLICMPVRSGIFLLFLSLLSDTEVSLLHCQLAY